MHSIFSDGSDTPEELAEQAARAGLTAVALTDHDTTASHERMKAACAAVGVELVPGVEISLRDNEATKLREDGSVEQGVSVHVLAYFVPTDPAHPFQQMLTRLRDDRRTRNVKLVSLLHEHGFTKLTYDHVLAKAESEYSVGRPHFAQVMFELHEEIVGENTPENWRRLFTDWLGQTGKAYLPKTDLTIEDAVAAAEGAGVVFSIAHPTLNYFGHYASDTDVMNHMPAVMASLRARGVQGIEAYYGSWNESRRALMLKLTKDAGMLATGGSDYHGSFKEDVQFARGLSGDLAVPDEVLVALKAARTRYPAARSA
jgi:hypothetical protein